jgi:hypothetical protein
MADWFVEVSNRSGLTEVFEFIDYRKAVCFGGELVEREGIQAVELLDCDGRVLMQFGEPFDGTHGHTSTPLRAGVYRWDQRVEQMRRVQP